MRLLITGACGFVGSELALALQENRSDIQITGIDNLSRRGSWRDLERLEQRGIRVLHGDIRQAADLENTVASELADRRRRQSKRAGGSGWQSQQPSACGAQPAGHTATAGGLQALGCGFRVALH
jgi:CDP-paratose 2-epimerase